MMGLRRIFLLPFLAILLLAACLSTNLAPIGSTGQFIAEDDERRLWNALREAEGKVAPPKALYEDPNLERYLSELVQRVTPPSYTAAGGQPISVKVRKDPRLNAGAMAHGVIVVHSGLVSRAQNEAQLAGVLAHEVAHITHRHQIRKQRELQNQQTAANVAALLGTLALAAAAVDQSSRGNYATAQAITQAGQPLLLLGLNLTYTAMVSGYSRDMEREADEQAVKMMAAAGYSPYELAKFFRIMAAESLDRGRLETFFWGSHPRTAERIEIVESEAKKLTAAGRSDGGDFERRTLGVRLQNALWDAYLGRWNVATSQVTRATALAPTSRRDAIQSVWEGQLHAAASMGARARGNAGDSDYNYRAAIDRFRRVIATTGTADQALAYRGLGHLYFANREFHSTHCEAKAAYTKYLQLQSTASDAASVKARVLEIRC